MNLLKKILSYIDFEQFKKDILRFLRKETNSSVTLEDPDSELSFIEIEEDEVDDITEEDIEENIIEEQPTENSIVEENKEDNLIENIDKSGYVITDVLTVRSGPRC